jgi:rSAM/selenodomain-associated transferase 1
MMKKAIIIFVRNPELGKVKTRLAKDLGEEKALEVYIELLQHTHDVATKVDCDKFVYYADSINENDLWENDLFQKRLQPVEMLGDRMMQAFMELFQLEYSKLLIIGSDCPELTNFIIDDAFEILDINDVVVGPSSDGGYYLLGLKKLIPELFKNKQWSTHTVLADTIKDIVRLQKTCFFLPELSDIDTLDDLKKYQQIQKI